MQMAYDPGNYPNRGCVSCGESVKHVFSTLLNPVRKIECCGEREVTREIGNEMKWRFIPRKENASAWREHGHNMSYLIQDQNKEAGT
jgi:hypothetical protein